MSALSWPDCLNVRDLGGLPTLDGGVTRAGALIRSDNLDRLTRNGIAALRAAGVSRIVDVRSAWECEHFPSEFTNTPLWRNMPISDPAAPDLSDRSLAEQFIWLLDNCARLIASAIAEIAAAPAGAVVVHCHAGKDRTGLVVALALDLVGVTRAAIAADYSTLGNSTIDVHTLIGTTDSGKPELEPLQEATILRVLDHLDNAYGGTVPYLRRAAVRDVQHAALRDRLTS